MTDDPAERGARGVVRASAVHRAGAAGHDPSRQDLERRLSEEGGEGARWWSNGPGDRYGWHDHPYHKILFCTRGSIVFHLSQGDVLLRAGDRLDIEPGTEHGATVGPEGVTCVEASRSA